MERHNSQAIGDVLRLAFQENAMQGRLDEIKAVNAWPQVVGGALSSQTGRPVVSNGVMTVAVPNASLRHEFMMNRTRLCRALNAAVGKETLTEIRFTS